MRSDFESIFAAAKYSMGKYTSAAKTLEMTDDYRQKVNFEKA